ncbi:MAG: AAA family ATPase [Bacteroidaceae bacterium]|nr:AAA family ATPase [Bacteroidaceae bacterium]
MSRSNLITKKQLSPDQRKGLAEMLTFMRDTSQREMVLTGAAGTGKTSLLHVFLKELSKEFKKIKVYCTAYTNEAVRVLSQRSGKNYDKTISGLLGLKLEQNEDKGKILVRDGVCHARKYRLIVIDEASMINDDCYAMIQSVLRDFPQMKILYVGDEAQLPPVNFASSVVFTCVPNIFRLTKVMRVSEDNPIIDLVTPIRDPRNMFRPEDCFEHVDRVNERGEGVRFYTAKKPFFENLFADFMSEEYKDNKNFCRLLAYTNNAVDKSNCFIRRHIFGNEVEEYTPGDDLIVTEGYSIPLAGDKSLQVYANGERLEVIEAEKYTEQETNIVCWSLLVDNYMAPSNKRELRHIKVVSSEGLPAYIALKRKLIGKARTLCAEVDPITGRPVHNRHEVWQEYYDFINSFCYVNYSYAMTIHKAQGSTIDNVYVVEKDINICDWDILQRNKLKYTAFTRAAKNLHILN